MTTSYCSADNWVPANGGQETESRSRSGRRILYCWQRSTGKHAYIDLDADRELPREYDPALDGTEHDPLLPPKALFLLFVINIALDHDQPLTVSLIEEQRDGSRLLWNTDVKRTAAGFPLLTSLQQHYSPFHHSREVAAQQQAQDLPCIPVTDRVQALTVVNTILRACNGETVISSLPAELRNRAADICHKLNGNPDLIWADVTLLRQTPSTTTAFNW